MAQDVRGDGLGYSGLAGGLAHGSLDVDLMQVMTAGASGARVDGKSGRGEHVLPAPLAGASAVFEGDAVGQLHIAVTLGQIRLVNGAHFGDLFPQFLDEGNRQRGDAVLAELLEVRPWQAIADLMEEGVFASQQTAIQDEEVVRSIGKKHGVLFRIASNPEQTGPPNP